MPRQFNQPYQRPTTNEWMFQMGASDPWHWVTMHPQMWDRVPFSERHRLPAASGLYAVFCHHVVSISDDETMDDDLIIYLGQTLDIRARHRNRHKEWSFRAMDATQVGFLEIPKSQLRHQYEAESMLRGYESQALDSVADTALNGNTDFDFNMRWLIRDRRIKPKAFFPEAVMA